MPDVDTGRLKTTVELDFRYDVNRAELVPQRHAAALGARIDAHIVEPPQAEEVRDALTDFEHRQRAPGARFHELHERGLGRVAAVEHEPDGGHGFSEVVANRGARNSGTAEDAKSADQNGVTVPAHQKVCLTRNSRA